MANAKLIRCPVCLASQTLGSKAQSLEQLYCGNCQRSFKYKDALPLAAPDPISAIESSGAVEQVSEPAKADTSTTVATDKTPKKQSGARALFVWFVVLIAVVAIFNYVRPYMTDLRGPEFLGFYLKYFFGVFIVVLFARGLFLNNYHVTLAGLILFEGVGAIRLYDGMAAGMHKFAFLYIMMVIGGLILITRLNSSSGSGSSSRSSSSSSWFNSSCSSCSSCSSSSCSSCSSGCGSSCGGCGGCGD